MLSRPRALMASLSLALVLVIPVACGFGEPAVEELPTVYGMFPLSTTSAAVQAEVVRAHHAQDMSRIDDAYDHARAALALDPLYAYGYLVAAWSAQSFDDYRAHLRRAIENSAGANEIERALIEAEQKAFDSDPEGALEIEQRLAAADPSNPLFQLLLGLRLDGLSRVEEGRAAMHRAIEIAPDYAGALTWLGVNYTIRQPTDFAQAEALLARAIEVVPDEPVPYDYMADLRRAQGRLDEALAGYTRAFELDPARGEFVGQRAHVRSFMGEYDAARADYQIAVTKDAEQAPWWTRQAGYTHIYEGDLEAALAEFDRARAIADTMSYSSGRDQLIATLWDAWLANGHFGRVDAAEQRFREVAVLARERAAEAGSDVFVRNVERNMANAEATIALWRRDYESARAKAREAMRIVADMPGPRRNEQSHFVLGMADLGQGRFTQAIAHFEQSDREDLYITYHRALALEGAGRDDEAMTLFRQVAEFRFSNLTTALVKPAAQARIAQLATN